MMDMWPLNLLHSASDIACLPLNLVQVRTAAKHGETSVDVNLSIGAKEQVLVQNSNNSKIINKNKNINQVIKCSF